MNSSSSTINYLPQGTEAEIFNKKKASLFNVSTDLPKQEDLKVFPEHQLESTGVDFCNPD